MIGPDNVQIEAYEDAEAVQITLQLGPFEKCGVIGVGDAEELRDRLTEVIEEVHDGD